METNCYLVCGEGLVIHPITSVSKECGDSISDFMHEDSDVFLRIAIRASPFPGAIKHSSVKFTKIRLGKRIAGLYASAIQRPFVCFDDVLSFPFIEFAL